MSVFMSIAIRTLEVVFAAGIIGSALVVLIVTVQDLIEVFQPEAEPEREA